ncbi:restriction endonuclease subunit S [Streptomyces fradiae]|uniref:restriction endonuclease subunit S n=1 Tax=Streptomyces fradiae TaxID=1906 RepID=UPI0037877505
MEVNEVQLGDVLTLERIPVDIDPDAEYRQIGIKSFGNGIFHRDPCLGCELSKLKYFQVHPDRLIVSNIMAWEGAIGISTESESGFVGSARFLSYRPTGDVDIRYLNYYFQSSDGISLIRSASTGTVARNQTLSPKNFEKSTVPLPSLDEQRRIADKLDSSFSRVNDVEALRSRMPQLLQELRESLISSVLRSNVTPVRVGDVVALTRTEIEVASDGLYRAIGMRSFGKGVIHYAPVPGSELSKLRYFTFPEGALVLSNIKAWEGAIGVTRESEVGYVASNRFLFYLPVDERVNVSYLRHYLLSRPGLAQVSANSPGGADRNRTLGIKRFEQIELPLPERSEQDRVALALDTLNTQLASSYLGTALPALRPALLNAAFSGQL